ALHAEGARVFVEVGPDAVLSGLVGQSIPDAFTVPVLRRDRDETRTAMTAVGRLHTAGVPLDWAALLPGARHTDLPTYAFQHERYWLDPEELSAEQSAEAGETSGTPQDAGSSFWQAVASEDTTALARLLDLDVPEEQAAIGAALPVLASWLGRRRAAAPPPHYRIGWTAAGPADDAPQRLEGTWLLAVPEDLIGGGDHGDHDGDHGDHHHDHHGARAVARLRGVLRAAGADVRILITGTGDESSPAPSTYDSLLPQLRSLLVSGPDPLVPAGVLSLLPLASAGVSQADPGRAAESTLALVHALAECGSTAPLWSLTSGAVASSAVDGITAPEQAVVWGLGRVLADRPVGNWGGVIDLEAGWSGRALSRLPGVLVQPAKGAETELAIRTSGVFARRLLPAEAPTASAETARSGDALPAALRGGVLVSGGDKEWREQVADRLFGAGVAHVRTTADLADIAPLPTGVSLTSVIHMPRAEKSEGLLEPTSAKALDEVLGAEQSVVSTLVALADGPDPVTVFLVMPFTSLLGDCGEAGGSRESSRIGEAGGTGAAAGEGTVRAAGPVLAAWFESMARQRAAAGAALRLVAVDRPDALVPTILGRAADRTDGLFAVSTTDWGRHIAVRPEARSHRLLLRIPQARAALAAAETAGGEANGPLAGVDGPDSLRRVLASQDARQRTETLIELVRGQAAVVLGHSSIEVVSAEGDFMDLGFASLTAVEFSHRLAAITGLQLPAELIYDYYSPAELAGYLDGELVSELPAG
ncbi:phosphopantetheine-binding protein, partial [Streptomyces sp. NPDC059651]|uniref:phosphopantetheine-binding protein n=1 Tax=Streptomyces sp. NPDC059651 TaxID=3346897 RepID=UPI00369667B4